MDIDYCITITLIHQIDPMSFRRNFIALSQGAVRPCSGSRFWRFHVIWDDPFYLVPSGND